MHVQACHVPEELFKARAGRKQRRRQMCAAAQTSTHNSLTQTPTHLLMIEYTAKLTATAGADDEHLNITKEKQHKVLLLSCSPQQYQAKSGAAIARCKNYARTTACTHSACAAP